MDDRMRKQIEFALLMDKQKNIFRQNHIADNSRRENDAEHAWHMAVMAYLFREYANEDIDISKVILMCLIHDIVEIEAGDTYAYDEEAKNLNASERTLQRSISSECYQATRGASLRLYLTSLKPRKLQRQGLQRLWITFSLYFSTKQMAARTGRNTELPKRKSCAGRRRREGALRSFLK